jgi:uncharacterized protein (UPF0147 family)
LEKIEYDKVTNISGNSGDVIGVGISGDGNIIGKKITIGGSININKNILDDTDPQFKNSIDEFEKIINEKLKDITVPQDSKKALQENVEKLAKEVKDVKPDQVIKDEDKVDSIKSYMINIADKIVELSPDIAESIASITPLAPFSKVIGKGTSFIAERIKKKLHGQ